MSGPIFKTDDGDWIYPTGGNLGIDSNGDMVMRLSDNLAMDLDSGEIHLTTAWNDGDDEP